jgi:hypothetical protein
MFSILIIFTIILILSLIPHIYLNNIINKYDFELKLVNQLLFILIEQKKNVSILKKDKKNNHIAKLILSSSIGPFNTLYRNEFDISDIIMENIPIFKIVKSIYNYKTDYQVIALRNISFELDNKIKKLENLKDIKNLSGIYAATSLISLLAITYSINLWWLIIIIIISLKLLFENFKMVYDVLEDEDIQALKKVIKDDFF